MANIYHVLITDQETGERCITVFVPGEEPKSASSESHPNFDEIVETAVAGDPAVLDLFDTAKAVSKRFEALTDRISVSGGTLYFDGDPVNNTLTRQVVRFLEEDVPDWHPLVLFFDNVKQNPNEHSVEQLYDWIEAQGADSGLTINSDGYIVGYKGVVKNSDGSLVSKNRGSAIVDGQLHSGAIPNALGSIVEMPRSEVTFDPAQGCSRGLHIGTYAYAKGWASGALLKVAVNPRDVVSVPTDSLAQKMRVCRYEVLEEIDAPVTSAYDYSRDEYEDDYDEYEDDYDYEY